MKSSVTAFRRADQRIHFPLAGPVREYRPLIIKQARWYSRKYYVNFFDVLAEAVSLAHLAERKFDPTRGTTFGTLLHCELQRLHRWCQREYRRRFVRSPRKSKMDGWERQDERARQRRERTSEVCWHGGRQDYYLDAPGGPRNYKRWKAAVGREKWPAMAERIGALSLDNDKWRAMRDWMVGDLLGRETRTMGAAAADLGITKGYASKIVCQIARACGEMATLKTVFARTVQVS